MTGQHHAKFGEYFCFLANQNVFRRHFFRFRDQFALQHLNFLNQLVHSRIAAFELSPTMDIHRILEFLAECLNFCAFVEKFATKRLDFVLQRIDACRRFSQGREFLRVRRQSELQRFNLANALTILGLALIQNFLLNLDFLVK